MRHFMRRLTFTIAALRKFSTLPIAALLALSLTWLSPWSNPAHAGQPRDWMIAVHPAGTDLNLDVVLPGTQVTLEHRIALYNNTVNQLTLRGIGLFTAGFSEAQVDADLRMVVLTLGGSVGYRSTYRNQTYEQGEDPRFMHRLERDLAGKVNSVAWPYAEGRIILSLPFNDGLVFNSINRFRFEGRPDRSFDWRMATVHDGNYFSSENMLLLKARNFGGMGPMIQVMNYDNGGRSLTQFNWGAVFTTRVGLRDRNDLIFIQALINTGGIGHDASRSYGLHYLTIPMSLVLAYRAVLPVWRPED